MNGQSILSALWLFSIAANIIAALRLLQMGLHRRYPVFFLYLLFQFGHDLYLYFQGTQSRQYFYIYLYTEPVLWILYILVVRELYSLILKDYPGIYSATRWTMYGAVIVSIGISFLTVLATLHQASGRSKGLSYYYLIERGIVFSLVLFIVCMLWFLSRYPIKLSRNIFIHSFLYSALFLSDAAILLVQSVTSQRHTAGLNLAVVTVSALCFSGWAVLFSKTGENALVRVRSYRDLGDADRLLSELDSINATLLRAARR
jgi:hypothetical protein